ncbi:MAG: hypothetical protein QOF33_1972 [Thermomicrobiales bacterium]|nr:hypothetical protein [Thermomicrobiales bacterium]
MSLTGPGGVGKTRLALEVAAELRDEFTDGIRFVGLAPVRDFELVAQAIAQTLGIRERSEEPLAARLATFLGDRHLLLLLDNFEHVVEAAPVVATLLSACPRLTVLATSRVRLRVSGEHEYAVPPLGWTELEEVSPNLRAPPPAVRLFVARAQAVLPEFALTLEHGPTIAAICGRLDGLPLAIELAAVRAKVLPPPLLLAKLEQRLPLLTGGGQVPPASRP